MKFEKTATYVTMLVIGLIFWIIVLNGFINWIEN